MVISIMFFLGGILIATAFLGREYLIRRVMQERELITRQETVRLYGIADRNPHPNGWLWLYQVPRALGAVCLVLAWVIQLLSRG